MRKRGIYRDYYTVITEKDDADRSKAMRDTRDDGILYGWIIIFVAGSSCYYHRILADRRMLP
jgi:hypothetical protein